MDVESLKEHVAEGKLTLNHLVSLIEAQQKRIAELEALVKAKNPTQRLDESYSAKAEEKRQAKATGKKKKHKPTRRGRVTTAQKIELAERTERVFPEGVAEADCRFSHTRVIWRLENGRATLVAYDIFRCGNQFGTPVGAIGRGEFGVEILIALGYQVYCIGLSIGKACQVLSFFQQLTLRKSQADALLNQLSANWEQEFDHLCTLLAHSAVVHTDETSWSINSVWAFLNEKLSVLFYGVHKDNATLAQILNKELFAGTIISDNASVYQNFTSSQKCWAHLIRKAIKLTLHAPDNPMYREFADGLLEIYKQAKQIKADGRLRDCTRAARAEDLNDRVFELCGARWIDESTEGDEIENDYRRLCNEVMRLMLDGELFVFVSQPEVDGTNNAAERQLRDDALARKTGRTSKTPAGAKRRSIITSVIQSIGKQLGKLTLPSVIDEVNRWLHRGRSCFVDQIEALQLTESSTKRASPEQTSHSPPVSLLDRIVLNTDKEKHAAIA